MPKASTGESLKINQDSSEKDEFGRSKEWQFQHSPDQLLFCTEQEGFTGCRAGFGALPPGTRLSHTLCGILEGPEQEPTAKDESGQYQSWQHPRASAPASAAAPALPEAIVGGL